MNTSYEQLRADLAKRDKDKKKTITLDKVSIWYDQKDEHIHITVRHKGVEEISTVNANPASKRGNPNLYKTLAKCLQEAGAPYPLMLE